jgi:hypothetical protein
MSMTGTAEASPGQPGEGYCTAGTPAPVYRSPDFARIYTIPVGNQMRIHKFVQVNGQSWAYGHAYQKPDGWTNGANFRSCVISSS